MKFKITILFIAISLQLQLLFAVEPFNFALLTDVHLSRDTTTVNDLKCSVNEINNTKHIDFVLVAGDMTEYGDTLYLRQAKQILDKLNMPYYIVPGNHETKLLPRGVGDFIRVFGNDKFHFKHKGFYFLGFNTGAKQGEGHVKKEDVKWIKKKLKKNGKNTPIILITHYPLQKGDVNNSDEVLKIAAQYDVKAVLTGHYHRNAVLSFGGIPGVVNRALQRNKDHSSGYSLYEIKDDSMFIYNKELNEEKDLWLTLPLDQKYLNQ